MKKTLFPVTQLMNAKEKTVKIMDGEKNNCVDHLYCGFCVDK